MKIVPLSATQSVIKVSCHGCGTIRSYIVLNEDLDEYLDGAPISSCFSNLSSEARDFITTEFCESCFNRTVHGSKD